MTWYLNHIQSSLWQGVFVMTEVTIFSGTSAVLACFMFQKQLARLLMRARKILEATTQNTLVYLFLKSIPFLAYLSQLVLGLLRTRGRLVKRRAQCLRYNVSRAFQSEPNKLNLETSAANNWYRPGITQAAHRAAALAT